MVANLATTLHICYLSHKRRFFGGLSTNSGGPNHRICEHWYSSYVINDCIYDFYLVDMTHGFREVVLDRESGEFATLLRRFTHSMPHFTILKITKIHNPISWSAFVQSVKNVNSTFPNICLKIRLLFHGSSQTDPKEIINANSGFNMKYSSGGLWGRGIYFAANSSYAHRYCRKLSEDTYCIFAAYVLIGYYIELPQDRNLSGPPCMPNGQCNYHSVQGKRDGELIHIVYKNSMAYPAFLIVYKTHD